ncbi:hypothetical protein HDE_09250 [Halotydeus destructor]|nr:hypothetical protein HDE_09250 [Halotydeus destructor]
MDEYLILHLFGKCLSDVVKVAEPSGVESSSASPLCKNQTGNATESPLAGRHINKILYMNQPTTPRRRPCGGCKKKCATCDHHWDHSSPTPMQVPIIIIQQPPAPQQAPMARQPQMPQPQPVPQPMPQPPPMPQYPMWGGYQSQPKIIIGQQSGSPTHQANVSPNKYGASNMFGPMSGYYPQMARPVMYPQRPAYYPNNYQYRYIQPSYASNGGPSYGQAYGNQNGPAYGGQSGQGNGDSSGQGNAGSGGQSSGQQSSGVAGYMSPSSIYRAGGVNGVYTLTSAAGTGSLDSGGAGNIGAGGGYVTGGSGTMAGSGGSRGGSTGGYSSGDERTGQSTGGMFAG